MYQLVFYLCRSGSERSRGWAASVISSHWWLTRLIRPLQCSHNFYCICHFAVFPGDAQWPGYTPLCCFVTSLEKKRLFLSWTRPFLAPQTHELHAAKFLAVGTEMTVLCVFCRTCIVLQMSLLWSVSKRNKLKEKDLEWKWFRCGLLVGLVLTSLFPSAYQEVSGCHSTSVGAVASCSLSF